MWLKTAPPHAQKNGETETEVCNKQTDTPLFSAAHEDYKISAAQLRKCCWRKEQDERVKEVERREFN